MIRAWLLKHRWVNELGKTVVAICFALFAYVCWGGGKLASAEIATADSYKLMVFGIGAGVMGMLALFIFTDVVYSVIGIIKQDKPHVASSKEDRK